MIDLRIAWFAAGTLLGAVLFGSPLPLPPWHPRRRRGSNPPPPGRRFNRGGICPNCEPSLRLLREPLLAAPPPDVAAAIKSRLDRDIAIARRKRGLSPYGWAPGQLNPPPPPLGMRREYLWSPARMAECGGPCWEARDPRLCDCGALWRDVAIRLDEGHVQRGNGNDGPAAPKPPAKPQPSGGGGGNVVTTRQISDAELDVLSEKVANDDALLHELIGLRGGCSCHISPPCHACTNELTVAEAIKLGILEDFDP